MKITINDVAREAGVSIATVSRAMNKLDDTINPHTKEKVRRVAKRLGYDLKSVMGNDILTVGILSPFLFNVQASPEVNSVHFSSLFKALETQLSAIGVNASFLPFTDSENEMVQLRDFINKKILQNIILVGPIPGKLIQFLESFKIPHIVLFHRIPGQAMNSVCVDAAGAVSALVSRLVVAGHRRIAMVIPEARDIIFRDIENGYRDALSLSGLEADTELVVYGKSENGLGRKETTGLMSLSSPPTAIIAGNDLIGSNILSALSGSKLKKDQKVKVIGFGGYGKELGITPPLTSLLVDYSFIANQAVLRLKEIIMNPETPKFGIMLPLTPVNEDSAFGEAAEQ